MRVTIEQIEKDRPMLEGAQGLHDDLDQEISGIVYRIVNVKACKLMDDKEAAEFKNFNKYDDNNLNPLGT